MKRFLMTFLAVCVMATTAYAQTRDIVPRADGEGGIGTTSKAWLDVYAKTITAATAYRFPEYTVAGLPSATPAGKVVSVTDGNGGCGTGGGSDRILCQSNGSAWVAVATVSGGSGDITGVFGCTTGDCQTVAIETGDVIRLNDNVVFRIGTNDDWTYQYDETTNDSLLWQTSKTVAAAAGTPMMRILVDNANAGMTADAVVFAIQKGLIGSPTSIFTIDEDGDAVFSGSVTAGGSGSSISFNSGGVLQDAANGSILLGSSTTLNTTNGTLIMANGPTCVADGAGEACIDGNQLVFHDGNAATTVSGTQSFDFTLELPTDADFRLIKRAPYDLTITRIKAIVDPADTGESVVLNIQECTSTGDSCANIDATAVTADNDGATDDGSIGSPLIEYDNYIAADIGAITSGGTLSELHATIYFTINRE